VDLLWYYELLFGEKICNTCPQNIYSALVYLKNNYKPQIDTIMSSNQKKYILKEGKEIQFFGEGTVYTNKNITDEIAENYLKKYPKKIVLFVGYPDTPAELEAELTKEATKKTVKKDATGAKTVKKDETVATKPEEPIQPTSEETGGDTNTEKSE
jgi:hypothetical protein